MAAPGGCLDAGLPLARAGAAGHRGPCGRSLFGVRRPDLGAAGRVGAVASLEPGSVGRAGHWAPGCRWAAGRGGILPRGLSRGGVASPVFGAGPLVRRPALARCCGPARAGCCCGGDLRAHPRGPAARLGRGADARGSCRGPSWTASSVARFREARGERSWTSHGFRASPTERRRVGRTRTPSRRPTWTRTTRRAWTTPTSTRPWRGLRSATRCWLRPRAKRSALRRRARRSAWDSPRRPPLGLLLDDFELF